MKAPSVSLLLGPAVLLFGLPVSAVFLNVSPNHQVFFKRDSVSLSCVEDGQTVDGWTVKRTAGGLTQTCGGGQQDFGRLNGSSCNISTLFPSDNGVYWCENRAGQRSVQVSISVSDRSVILELPRHPVPVGSHVTLHCKTRESYTQTVYFFRNESFLGTGQTGEFTISDVQPSHEGLYWCSTGLLSGSLKSWLSVRDPDPDNASPLSVVRLLCHLLVVCPFCISTILVVSIYCSKRTENKPSIFMEMNRSVEGGLRLAEEHDVAAGVTTEHAL